MNKYSFHNNKKAIATVIDRLSENKNLSEWEKQFVESIKKRFDFGHGLSEKQTEKLSNIWEKY